MTADGAGTDDVTAAGAAAALADLPELGTARLRGLLQAFGDPAAVWSALWHDEAAAVAVAAAVPPGLARQWSALARRADVGAVGRRLRRLGVEALHLGDDRFPVGLRDDRAAAAVLFVRGDPGLLSGPAVAIVGTRRATHYGRDVAAELGGGLARAGVPVVSGLALGVDGAAHQAVLANAGRPVGVVGSGHDVVYPPRHAGLWQAVGDRGVLVSEFPPGTPPDAWRFPVRNRTIALLARVVVVVESHESGGSLITARLAEQLGRTVLAVPGSVRSPASAGTNALLRHGPFAPCCDVGDVLVALSLAGAGALAPVETRCPPSPAGEVVLRALGWEAAVVERLVQRSGLSPTAVVVELHRLERDGWVARDGGRWHRLASAPGVA